MIAHIDGFISDLVLHVYVRGLANKNAVMLQFRTTNDGTFRAFFWSMDMFIDYATVGHPIPYRLILVMAYSIQAEVSNADVSSYSVVTSIKYMFQGRRREN